MVVSFNYHLRLYAVLDKQRGQVSCQNTSFISCDKNPWFCVIGQKINGLI